MHSALKILLLLPVLAHGQIDISVDANGSLGDAKVTFRGESIDLISDAERTTFTLTDWQLKEAVEKLSGGRPGDVFVRGPTHWNLYSNYNWREVQRTLRPVRAKVMQLKSAPVTIATKFFDNRNFSGISKFQGTISLQKKNTITSTWSNSQELSFAQEIKFGFNVGAAKLESTTSFSLSTSWGKDTSKSETTTLGSESGIEIELEGGQAAVALLSANRGEMVVEVEYEASLAGQVAANYPSRYRDHYFWAYDVNAVLAAAGRPTILRSKQTVRVGFYSDDTVAYYDYQTGTPLTPVSKK